MFWVIFKGTEGESVWVKDGIQALEKDGGKEGEKESLSCCQSLHLALSQLLCWLRERFHFFLPIDTRLFSRNEGKSHFCFQTVLLVEG